MSTPRLVTHRDVAKAVGTSTANLRRWVERGQWPRPHSVVEQTWFYKVEDVEHYIRHGRWPDHMARPAREG